MTTGSAHSGTGAGPEAGTLVLATLLATSSLTVMAGATIAPSLPGLAAHFADVPNAGTLARLALTLPALLIAVGAPVAGAIVDRMGPRRVLLASLVLYVAGGTSGLWVPDLWSLLVGRLALGLAVAGVMTATTTLIAIYYPGTARDRVLGLQGFAMSIGGVVFLSLGGVLAEGDWRLPFAIYALPLLILPVATLRIRGSDDSALPRTGASEPTPALALATRYGSLYAIAFAAMLLFYVVPTQVPFLLGSIGLTDAALAGYAIALSTVASAATSLLAARLQRSVRAWPILTAMFGLLGLGLLGAGFADGFAAICVAMLVIGAGAGLIMPVLSGMVLARADPATRGRAIGGLSTAIFLGQFLSPLAFAVLGPGRSVSEAFVLVGAVGLAGAVALAIGFARGGQTAPEAVDLPNPPSQPGQPHHH